MTEQAVTIPSGDFSFSVEAIERREVRFLVEGRPVAYCRMTRGTKWSVRAQRYFAYREAVAARAKEAGAEPWKGPVHVQIQAYVKRRTFDLDNLCKGILDALSGVAFADDRQVEMLYAAIAISGEECLQILVEQLP